MTFSHNNIHHQQETLLPFSAQAGGMSCCSVSLRLLFPQASFVGCADIVVAHVVNHSNDCKTGSLFAAMTGTYLNGTTFIDSAIQNGATSVMVEQPVAEITVPQIIVKNVREAYAKLTAALNNHPSSELNIAAITGTNGKTTVTWLIRSILQSAGHQTGLLGTIEYNDSKQKEASTLSTPDAQLLSQWLGSMVQQNTTHVAMEVTSHALDQHRLAGTEIDVAVVTNITQDHFDYHQNETAYKKCKATLFNYCKPNGTVVLNLDDANSKSLQAEINQSTQLITYSLDESANVTASIQEMTLQGSRFLLSIDGEEIGVRTSLFGKHHISNCLAAAAVAHRFGVSLDEIAAGIQSLEIIPGRMERIDCGQSFGLFVDYAHTDDALRKTILALREITTGRIITVFGAGGDRDRSKRALLGRAASLADIAVVTSDNPRTENPQQIIDEIVSGIQTTTHIEIDRESAIQWAIEEAEPCDILLVAGKGHETEQLIGTKQIPFDDRVVCRNILKNSLQSSRLKQFISA